MLLDQGRTGLGMGKQTLAGGPIGWLYSIWKDALDSLDRVLEDRLDEAMHGERLVLATSSDQPILEQFSNRFIPLERAIGYAFKRWSPPKSALPQQILWNEFRGKKGTRSQQIRCC